MQDRRHPLLPQTAITGFRKQGRRQERGPKQALEVHRHPNGWMWVEFITIRWSLVVSLWDCGAAPLRPGLNTQKASSRVTSRLVLAIHSYCWRKVLVEGYTSEKWHFGREGPAVFSCDAGGKRQDGDADDADWDSDSLHVWPKWLASRSATETVRQLSGQTWDAKQRPLRWLPRPSRPFIAITDLWVTHGLKPDMLRQLSNTLCQGRV